MQLGAVVVAAGVLDVLYSGVGSVVAWLVILVGLFNVYRGWAKRRA